ncbi:cytochrome c biogenesis protein [Sulfuriroseicoccus oceanibius]|uniref:Cytochrome c biogenesis protein CcsA n=1 Tax=Sulfuriroseicoccus oceanibius TaxID=2707525 RepID=A0A6B3L955_9BACT|nr:cytochrome c biogenesis protein CcsA [Sulfuriroseicoccus oceanibius]QQL46031.1 cytochrome c biogenesis protein CcsA [Sulfuriroseicoccus oceanibius]
MATQRTKLSKSTKITAWVLALITLVAVAKQMTSPRSTPESGPNFAEFGRIPVLKSGRIKPLDTLARNQLLAIHGKGVISGTDMAKKPAHATVKSGRMGRGDSWVLDRNAWLAEVLFDGPAAATRDIILVENDNVKALFGEEGSMEKRFSARTILAARDRINQLATTAAQKPKDRITTFDKQITAVAQRVGEFLNISSAIQPPGTAYYEATLQDFTRMMREASAAMQGVDLEGSDTDVANRLNEDQSLQIAKISQLMAMMQEIDSSNTALAMHPLPPLEAGADISQWRKAGAAAIAPERTKTEDAALMAWARIGDGYRAIAKDNGASFNQAVSDYLAWIDSQGFAATDKSQTEFWFNGADPFMISLVIYIIAGLIILAGWLIWREQLTVSAFWIIVIALIVHTIGIALRIYLSGRPPVTNLYSSAVFVGWGGAAVALLLEKGVLRNGIGSFVAACLGVLSLIIARQLSFDGDTMEVKQAVLDSNFWLTTHVIIITLGYSACFLAGFLGLIYGIANMISPNILGKDGNRALYASTYGIVCFALLFSFVGTVLGGIWADQSWGRFWGWDPKENGALIIVLWNALMLHARLGGICRDPGFMAMSILGIAITLWSWFGTNLLGVGLHSYGFREGALEALGWSCVAIVVMAGLTVVTHRKPTKA